MSQYITDEVLDMMEQWVADHENDPDLDKFRPFKGFDGLLGADLLGIDLSKDKIREKTREWTRQNPGKGSPPWVTRFDGGINLGGAVLSQDADGKRTNLRGADLRDAYLWSTPLQRADLYRTQLQGASLAGAEIKEARLEHVDWSDGYVLGDELLKRFNDAETAYRQLKQYSNGTGQYDLAGEFHLREMVMRRKNLWQPGPYSLRQRFQAKLESLVLLLLQFSSGYGERPSWVLGWVVACWAGFTLAYWLGNALPGSGSDLTSFIESMRHSARVTTSFGQPSVAAAWARDAGLVQSFLSYFLLALFLVTFVRKMARA